MGKNLFHVGGIGTGHAMKLVNNATSAACLTATAEAIAVARYFAVAMDGPLKDADHTAIVKHLGYEEKRK